MATANNGMPSEGNIDSTPKKSYSYDNKKLNNHDDNEHKIQEIIDTALIKMSNGDYNEAILLLDKAKELYNSEQAQELQDLIIKMQTREPKATENSKTSSVHQRHYSNSQPAHVSQEYNSPRDFTNEQLNLVEEIKNCKNYYQVLSVSSDASENEIKKAYKRLALHLHPDKNHAPGAVEAFKTLGNAMAVLVDVQKRKEYDINGGNYITKNENWSHIYKSNSVNPQYYTHGRQHQNNYQSYSTKPSFREQEEFTTEELFHMFFGNYASNQGYYRRRAYQFANQRQPQEHRQQPGLAFGFLLVVILMSMFMSLLSTDPLYSLSHSSKYKVRRLTQRLSVPYYVKDNFEKNYQGSLVRFENSVEENYIHTMKQNCFRERSYREAMMARARSFGSRANFAQAQGLKMPSCENLSKIGITRYSLY